MSAATQLPPRKRFTRAEVQQMTDAGIFVGQRYELIDGDLIDKMGQNPPHAISIRLLSSVLAKLFGSDRVMAQLPIEVAIADQERNEPEPDVAVSAETSAAYHTRHPRGDELLLLVEVSDTTLRHDLTTKRELYARAGVPEYWVLDIPGRRLIVHRALSAGSYSHVTTIPENESATVACSPDAPIPVAAILP